MTRKFVTTRAEYQWDEAQKKYVLEDQDGYWYDGSWSHAHNGFRLDQQQFAFAFADGPRALANNVNLRAAVGDRFLLSLGVKEVGGDTGDSVTWLAGVQYRVNTGGGFGAWTAIPNSGPDTLHPVRCHPRMIVNVGTLLSLAGTRRVTIHIGDPTWTAEASNHSLSANDWFELGIHVEIHNGAGTLAPGSEIEFRYIHEGAAIFAYTVTPKVTISATPMLAITKWRWLADDGTEATANWAAPENTPVTLDLATASIPVRYRCRMLVRSANAIDMNAIAIHAGLFNSPTITDMPTVGFVPVSRRYALDPTNLVRIHFPEAVSSRGLTMSTDGTKLFLMTSAYVIRRYTMSTPGDIRTAVQDQTYTVPIGGNNTAWDLRFSEDGTKFFIQMTSAAEVQQYTLSVAWDLTSTITGPVTMTFDLTGGSLYLGMDLSDTGSSVFVMSLDSNNIFNRTHLRPLSTPYDLTTAGAQVDTILDQRTNMLSAALRGIRYLNYGDTIAAVIGSALSGVMGFHLNPSSDVALGGLRHIDALANQDFISYDKSFYGGLTDFPKFFGNTRLIDVERKYGWIYEVQSGNSRQLNRESYVGSSAHVRGYNSTNLTYLADTTQRLGVGTFLADNNGVLDTEGSQPSFPKVTAVLTAQDQEFELDLPLEVFGLEGLEAGHSIGVDFSRWASAISSWALRPYALPVFGVDAPQITVIDTTGSPMAVTFRGFGA